jgi:transcriptional repressor NrdR
MFCINCGEKTNITNSRFSKRLKSVWRRRQCSTCKNVFTTREFVDYWRSFKVANSNVLEPFVRDKLFLSIYESLRHRKTAITDAEAITETVLTGLLTMRSKNIPQKEIIKLSYVALRRFDAAAAVQFKAFHPISVK